MLDNACYQKCAVAQALAASLKIELLYLPSHSPNLNLIERLWRSVRMESLNSTYHEEFEDFSVAIDGCLDGLSTVHKREMETLMTHRFQLFEDVPLLPRGRALLHAAIRSGIKGRVSQLVVPSVDPAAEPTPWTTSHASAA